MSLIQKNALILATALGLGLAATGCTKHETAEGGNQAFKTEEIAAKQGEAAKAMIKEPEAKEPATYTATTAPASGTGATTSAVSATNTATATASSAATQTTETTTSKTVTAEPAKSDLAKVEPKTADTNADMPKQAEVSPVTEKGAVVKEIKTTVVTKTEEKK